MSINNVVLYGVVNRVFDESMIGEKKDLRKRAFILEHTNRKGRAERFVVTGIGDRAVDAINGVWEGIRVLVKGTLTTYTFKNDKDEWITKVEINLVDLVDVSGGIKADDAEEDNGGYVTAGSAGPDDDSVPF